MEGSFPDKVRKAAAELKGFTLDEICERLDVRTYQERDRVRRTLRDLIRWSKVSAGPNEYRYKGKPAMLKQERMWRAMLIKGHFSRSDVMRLTGAARHYCQEYITFLHKSGFIEIADQTPGRAYTWRVVDPECAPIEYPRMPCRKAEYDRKKRLNRE